MELTAALTAVAAQTGLNAEKLMEYADEWQGDNERKFLYAIVRTLRPVNSLELGTHTGEGATCIVQAMLDGLGTGNLITVDILDEPHIGSAIPIGLRQYVTLVTANIDEWIAVISPRESGVNIALTGDEIKSGYDFIFDDGSHSIHQVHQIYGHLDQLLNPGGIILSHDAAAGGVGDYIREGQTKSGYDLPVFIIDPAPWGFSIYRKPGWETLPEPKVINHAELLEVSIMPDGSVEGSWLISREDSDLDAIIHESVIIRDEDLPPAPATEEFVDDLKDPTGVKKIAKKPRKNRPTRKGSTK